MSLATPRGDAPRVSITVAVVSYGRPEHLRRCLEAVLEGSREADAVLVGLRPEDQESHAVCRPFEERLRVVPVHEPGQVAALNAVLARCDTEVVAFVDDDAVPVARWLEAIDRWFSEHPDVGAVGGRDVVHHGDRIDEGRTDEVGRVRWWGRLVGRHHWRSGVQEVMFLKGANMAFRREALAGFDRALRGAGAQVCNDLDASLGVHRRGWRVIWDPAVAVDHFPAPRMDDDRRDSRSRAAVCAEQFNELYVLLKHQPRWQLPVLAAYRLVLGYRRSPGPLLAIVQRLVPGRAGDAPDPALVRAVTGARWAAVGAWLRSSPTAMPRRPGPPSQRG